MAFGRTLLDGSDVEIELPIYYVLSHHICCGNPYCRIRSNHAHTADCIVFDDVPGRGVLWSLDATTVAEVLGPPRATGDYIDGV